MTKRDEVKILLVEYSFKNFCSFKDETKFSLRATADAIKSSFPDNYFADEQDVLKTAVIVGENAGGKTNFVKSLQYLKNFFKENRKVESASEYINDDYTEDFSKLTYADTTQKFSLGVLIKGTMYYYDLEIDFLGVKSEKLEVVRSTDNSRKKILVVTRTEKEPLLSDFVKSPNEFKFANLKYEVRCIPFNKKDMIENEDFIGLFVSKYALLGLPEALVFSQWMNDTLMVESAIYDEPRMKGSYFQNLDDWRVINDKKFLEILRIIEPSIETIKPDQRLPYQETIITRKNSVGKIFNRELRDDSAGLKDYFAWAVQIYKVIYENKILFADEMDRSLNPILADKIISLIHGSDHKGQFIFTTHNVLHLNLEKYMKEQIYFVTKNVETLQSEIYSLAEFTDVDYNSGVNLYEYYLRGVLGGTMSE